MLSLQGEGMGGSIACIFSNGTVAKRVNATMDATGVCALKNHPSLVVCTTAVCLPAGAMACETPEWPLDLGDAAAVTLHVTAGNCSSAMPFAYYVQPEVTSVFPLEAPRYGSFLLTVNLDNSLQGLLDDEVRCREIAVYECQQSLLAPCQ